MGILSDMAYPGYVDPWKEVDRVTRERDEARDKLRQYELVITQEDEQIVRDVQRLEANLDRLLALLREVVATGEHHLGLHPEGISMVLPHDLYRRVTAAALEGRDG